jgi:hypothetical protein
MLWGVVEDEVGIVVDEAKHVIQRIRLADSVGRDARSTGTRLDRSSLILEPAVTRPREGAGVASSVGDADRRFGEIDADPAVDGKPAQHAGRRKRSRRSCRRRAAEHPAGYTARE